MLDEHIEFLERALVEQKLDALAGGQLAAFVLGLDALYAAAQPRIGAPLFQPVEDVFHGRPAPIRASRPQSLLHCGAKAIP